MNENQRTNLHEQIDDGTKNETVEAKVYCSVWIKFLIILHATSIALTTSMHIPAPIGPVILVLMFIGYAAIGRFLYLHTLKRQSTILDPQRTIICLYFICICLLYCFELGYDIASGCHTGELLLDLINLFLPLLWFIIVGVKYYLARRDESDTLVVEIHITSADYEEDIEE